MFYGDYIHTTSLYIYRVGDYTRDKKVVHGIERERERERESNNHHQGCCENTNTHVQNHRITYIEQKGEEGGEGGGG